MKTANKIILAGAFALGVAGAADGATADGGWTGDGDREHHRMCDRDMSTRFDMMTVYLENQLGLTEAQIPAWNNAVTAVEDAMAAKQAACEAADEQGRPETVVDALERAETRMAAGLEEVRSIRVAVDELYAVLDDQQRATFDELIREMRHMRG